MALVTYLDTQYPCTTAIKGEDYIHLLDERGRLRTAFDGISDFSDFSITDGDWTSPTPEEDCCVAVVKDDGLMGKGGLKCSDILTKNDVGEVWQVSPQMFGAVADGVTDDSAAMQAAIQAAAASSGALVLPAGTYLLHDIEVPADLCITGQHAVIQLASQSDASNQFKNVFHSTAAIHFEMSGVTVKGLGPALAATDDYCSVLDFTNAASVVIENCTFENIRTKNEVGLYAIIAKIQECDHVTLRNNVMREIGGFELVHIKSTGLFNGVIEFCHNYADTIYGYTWNLSSGYVLIDSNKIVNFKTPASMFNLCGAKVVCTNNNAVDCMCSDVFDTSESGGMRALHFTAENNTTDCIGAIFAVFSGTHCTIRNNRHRGKALMDSCNVIKDSYTEGWDLSPYKDMDSISVEGNTCELGVCCTDSAVTGLSGILITLNRFGIGIMNPARYGVSGGRVHTCVIRDNTLDYSNMQAVTILNTGILPIGISDNIDNCTIADNTFVNPPGDTTLSSVTKYGIQLCPFEEDEAILRLRINGNVAIGDNLTHFTLLLIKTLYVAKTSGVVCKAVWLFGNGLTATVSKVIATGGSADGFTVTSVYGDYSSSETCSLGQSKTYNYVQGINYQ